MKLLFSFAPWLSFLIIARGSLERLELGLGVALALSVTMGLLRLHRGIILWVGLAFFSLALVLVMAFHNMWTVQHMGVLANGALAAGAWVGIVRKSPFTLDYAKDHTPREAWTSAPFLRANMIISTAWAMAFTASAALAWMKMERLYVSDLAYEGCSYAILIATALFTQLYPAWLKRRATTG
nr:hypothetical protein [Rhodoblastus sphagnicola]